MKIPYRLKKFVVDLTYPTLSRFGFLDTIKYFGIDIPLNIPILTPEIRKAFLLGTYEDKECKTISSLLSPGERVLEIGVGLGVISTLILKNPNVSAYKGYEANPELLPWIEKIFNLNGVSSSIENALLVIAPTQKHSPFYQRENFWASSMDDTTWGYQSIINVPLQDFERLLDSYKPTLLVCDIEGGEYDLLKHANLGSVNKIYLEVHPKVLGEQRIATLFNSLSDAGFVENQRYSLGDVRFLQRV